MVCWGRQLDITGGQRRESEFSHYNSILQFPRTSIHGHLTNWTSWGAKTPAPQSSTPQKNPKHHKVVPPFSASRISCEMYNTLCLHWGLCTSQQHKFPQAQPSQCKSWMLSQSFRLPELMSHNSLNPHLPSGVGSQWPGMGNCCLDNSLISSLSYPPATIHTQIRKRPTKLNYAGGDNHSVSRGEIQRVTTERLQGELQPLAGWYLQTQGLHWRSLWESTHGFQQQSSPNLVYVGLSIGIESMF